MKLLLKLLKTQKTYSKYKLLIFYRQLKALLKAGVPIIHALEIIKNQSDGQFRSAINQISNGLKLGNTLASSFEKAGFPASDINLIRVAEVDGRVEEALGRIEKCLDRSISSREKIKKALMYPMIVLSLSFMSVIFLLVFIIPSFKNIFSDFSFELPLLTKILLTVSDFWWMILLLLIGISIFTYFLFKKDKVKRSMPIFGSVYKNLQFSSFCRSLGYQLKGGVPLLKALSIIQNGVCDLYLAKALKSIYESLENGIKLSEALTITKIFPDSLIQIVRIGEESGSLDQVLIQAAEYYEEECDSMIKKLIVLVEPLSTLFVGGVVALVAFSMIVPLFSLMETIQ
jgi:type IV pilus assembly protein PilC